MTTKVFLSSSTPGDRIAALVRDELAREGIEVREAQHAPLGVELGSHIAEEIRGSDALIAVFHDGSRNVAFEIGFAMGANRGVLLVTEQAETIPSELGTLPCIRIGQDTQLDLLETLRRVLARAPREATRPRAAFASALEELGTVTTDPPYFEAMEYSRFERLVADVFRSKGFIVTFPPPSRPAGYDFVVEGPETPGRVAVEVKKVGRQRLISVEHVRQLLTSVQFARAAAGVLISSSEFTASAIAFAETSQPRLTLMPLGQLLLEDDTRRLLGYATASRPADDVLQELDRLTDEAKSDYRSPMLYSPEATTATSVAEATREFQLRAHTLLGERGAAETLDYLISTSDVRYAERFREIRREAAKQGLMETELLHRFAKR